MKKGEERVKGSRLRNESTLLFLDEGSVSGRSTNLYNYCFL